LLEERNNLCCRVTRVTAPATDYVIINMCGQTMMHPTKFSISCWLCSLGLFWWRFCAACCQILWNNEAIYMLRLEKGRFSCSTIHFL